MLQQLCIDRVIMDEVSVKEFYAAFEALGDRVEERIDKRFNTLDQKLDDHADEDRAVADRVLTIEVERKKEIATAANRITLTVAGMTVGASVIIELVKHFIK